MERRRFVFGTTLVEFSKHRGTWISVFLACGASRDPAVSRASRAFRTPATAALTTPVQAWALLWTDLFDLQRRTWASLAEAAGTRRSTGR